MVPAKAPVLKLLEGAPLLDKSAAPVGAGRTTLDVAVLFRHEVSLLIIMKNGWDCEKRLATLSVSYSITVYAPVGISTAGQSTWHATDGAEVDRTRETTSVVRRSTVPFPFVTTTVKGMLSVDWNCQNIVVLSHIVRFPGGIA